MEVLVGALLIAAAILGGFVVLGRRRPGDEVVSQAVRTEFQTLFQLSEERVARQMESGANELQGKKALIDQQLQGMHGELAKVSDLMRTLERDREGKFGELTTQLKAIGEQTAALTTSTQGLREALANSRARGQWGERMAEDILRLVGMAEGVNYLKQVSIAGAESRPDFVFLLPEGLKLNMDVKFPLDNYMRCLEAETDALRTQHRGAFLRDVRARVKEITNREYIDPEQGTVDYVLLFIPNESVYGFIHEHDPNLLDTALQQKVVCCSPLTLFAVLAVVRQATDNFALRRDSEQIISQFGRFYAEWGNFAKALETLGSRIVSAQRAFDILSGRRRRALERPLARIEELRQQRGIPVADDAGGGAPELAPEEDWAALLGHEDEEEEGRS